MLEKLQFVSYKLFFNSQQPRPVSQIRSTRKELIINWLFSDFRVISKPFNRLNFVYCDRFFFCQIGPDNRGGGNPTKYTSFFLYSRLPFVTDTEAVKYMKERGGRGHFIQ